MARRRNFPTNIDQESDWQVRFVSTKRSWSSASRRTFSVCSSSSPSTTTRVRHQAWAPAGTFHPCLALSSGLDRLVVCRSGAVQKGRTQAREVPGSNPELIFVCRPAFCRTRIIWLVWWTNLNWRFSCVQYSILDVFCIIKPIYSRLTVNCRRIWSVWRTFSARDGRIMSMASSSSWKVGGRVVKGVHVHWGNERRVRLAFQIFFYIKIAWSADKENVKVK